MKRKLLSLTFFLFMSCSVLIGQELQKIKGRITDSGSPLEGVGISIKDSEKSTSTKTDGTYQLQVSPGDVIKFEFLGFRDALYVVEDHSRVVNINMIPNAERLDEVVVEGRRNRQKVYREEYATNLKLIQTAFGILNKETSGFALRIIDGDDLFVGGDILNALQSHIPGIQIIRPLSTYASFNNNGSLGRVTLNPIVYLPRRFNSIALARPAVFEVDGVIYTEPPLFLDPTLIDRIGVINSASGLTRYGQIAAGGLIIINTKSGPFASGKISKAAWNDGRLTNNIFEEFEVSKTADAPRNKYVEMLYTANSQKEAEALLSTEKMLERSSSYVDMEIGDYFLDQWDDLEKFRTIYWMVADRNSSNATVLKAVAYRFQEVGLSDEAWELYKKIFMLRPSYGQSYVDLAHASAETGDREKAADLLARYIRYKGLDYISGTEGIDSIIKRDFRYYLDTAGEDSSTKSDEELIGSTRLYFEWNNGDAEFQLQFVNPENRFYEWDHTYDGNFEQILKEKTEGFSSAQFVIDENLPGKWLVNIRYQGNKSYDPTFIKSTVYLNYGTPFEIKRTYWHRLTEKKVLLNLFNMVHNPVYRIAAP